MSGVNNAYKNKVIFKGLIWKSTEINIDFLKPRLILKSIYKLELERKV